MILPRPFLPMNIEDETSFDMYTPDAELHDITLHELHRRWLISTSREGTGRSGRLRAEMMAPMAALASSLPSPTELNVIRA